uniref:Protein NRT1/ PTR FAMILY 5.10 n=1 Tax=Zea mays TaxID=4577 RepID=C4JAB1_MAIZE|nr:unknown [Zea mays]
MGAGVEIAERFAYHGVSANLISYLTGPLGESTAGAAAAINAWSGVATMLPLLMACVADAWLGRYRTIVLASLLFVVVSSSFSSLPVLFSPLPRIVAFRRLPPIRPRDERAFAFRMKSASTSAGLVASARLVQRLRFALLVASSKPRGHVASRDRLTRFASLSSLQSMGMLTVSALPAFHHDGCSSYASASRPLACSPPPVQVGVFYVSLYLVALAEAGHKPCAQAFGADQFDQNDPKESASRSSFFNWWYFGMCSGTAVTTMVSSYIQDNVGWGLGFGVPCLVMLFALLMFLLGTRNYRYYTYTESSPFARLATAFVALIKGSKSRQHDG